jgi:hypothetical protein
MITRFSSSLVTITTHGSKDLTPVKEKAFIVIHKDRLGDRSFLTLEVLISNLEEFKFKVQYPQDLHFYIETETANTNLMGFFKPFALL